MTTTDQARALNAVLDDLDLGDVALVGASYGGMVALSFAVLFPVRTRTVVTVCAAHRTHPMATAVRWVQREVVRLGRRGRLTSEALALARALAMTTYRSAAEFDVRFDHAASVVDGRAKFPVEWYLESRGADFAARQDAQRFLRLSESIDLHDVNPARVRCPLTAVSFDTDTLVPPSLVADLVGRAGGPSRHVELSSRYGHDAFLKEGEVLASVLPRSFGPLEAGR